MSRIYQLRDELKSLGVKMVSVLRENLPTEVQAFQEDVWKDEPIYLDHQFQFFSALGGGEPNQVPMTYWVENTGKPSDEFKEKTEKSMKLAEGFMTKQHHNTIGQGLMTGGLYVLRQGGVVEFAHQEAFPGHTVDAFEVLAAAQRAVASSKL